VSETAAAGGDPGLNVEPLIERSPAGIVRVALDGRVLYANPAAARLLGFETASELLAHNAAEFCPGPDASALLARVMREHSLAGVELELLRAGGAPVWVSASLSLSSDQAGGPAVEGTLIDIGARKHAEEALKQSNRQLTSVLESITDSFIALDRDWRLTYLNRRAEQLVGRTHEDLEGKDLWREFPGLAGSEFEARFRRAAAERRPAEFTAYYEPLKLWLDVHVYPSGTGLSMYMQDVTARKELEEQLGQSQRLEALGRLAGGVAHDFNNLLTIIGGYGQMALQRLEGGHELRKDLESIVEAASRASALTRQLLAFSRRQVVQEKVIDLNRLVAKMNKMLRRVIDEDVELRLALRANAGRIKADAVQLEQVLMNLAVNARDAMPTGGQLTIGTEGFECGGPGGPHGLAPGSYVLLTVRDSGTGMDEHTRRHLFEPFFTTKAKGKGTGLGLATVYGIVKQSGGEIWVESEPGQGACFRIWLPRANKTPKRQGGPEGARRARRGSETILVVEDEAEVRRLACGMLSRLGYKVIEAGDGPDALALIRDCGKLDLLLTDVIMPQMSGRELAERLQALQPGLKVLFVSGYGHDVIARHGVVETEAALLHKPFTHEALAIKVRSVLDESPVAG
jgi:two-component system cell cycle sensor histidine kinase/response regulator CckA